MHESDHGNVHIHYLYNICNLYSQCMGIVHSSCITAYVINTSHFGHLPLMTIILLISSDPKFFSGCSKPSIYSKPLI